jgi:nucleotide-binding universal stress UspA family protein
MTAASMTRLDRPIVVGLDSTAQTAISVAAAIELGAWEATRHHVDLSLVYGYGTAYPWTRAEAEAVRRATADRFLAHHIAATKTAHPGLTVRGSIHADSAANTLVAASATASLVIVCSDARVHYGGLQAGLVSVQVAAHALAPVIVVATPRLRPAALDRPLVVVGVDGSTGCNDAIGFAFDEAHARDADLHAISVDDGGGERAEQMLRVATDEWRHKYPEVRLSVVATAGANPVRALNDAGVDADLVVVGARGRGGFATLLLGSVSDGLVRYSRSSIAVVPTER